MVTPERSLVKPGTYRMCIFVLWAALDRYERLFYNRAMKLSTEAHQVGVSYVMITTRQIIQKLKAED
jgi:hypothetical protein